jgi:hypothetical protein
MALRKFRSAIFLRWRESEYSQESYKNSESLSGSPNAIKPMATARNMRSRFGIESYGSILPCGGSSGTDSIG